MPCQCLRRISKTTRKDWLNTNYNRSSNLPRVRVLLLRLPHPTAAKRLLVSDSLHHFVCSHQRWRRRPRARRTHSSHIRSFRRAALFGLWLRRNDAPTGASVSTLDFRRARRALWHQRGLGRRRPLPQRPCVLQTGLGLGPAVRFERRPRLAWTELDSSRR